MIEAVIIEDEFYSVELLSQLLHEFCTDVKVIGSASNVADGIKICKELKPDLIFLDIEMPGGGGFEVLKAFDPIPFKVIFVTGYAHFAIQAIKYSALDYLLKPVDISELKQAVEKAKKASNLDKIRLENFQWNLQNSHAKSGQLIISSDKEHAIVKIDEIIFLQALGGYVNLFLEGGRQRLSTYSLGYFENLLPPELFFRTHKSFIVNCDKVISVSAGRGGAINLQEGHTAPIAFRRKSAFVEILGNKNN